MGGQLEAAGAQPVDKLAVSARAAIGRLKLALANIGDILCGLKTRLAPPEAAREQKESGQSDGGQAPGRDQEPDHRPPIRLLATTRP